MQKNGKLSRSKIDLFVECPRCFYMDYVLGIRRPAMPAFTLNSAVDHLLKKEFDIHRAKGRAHPLMQEYGLAAVPFKHRDLEKWRHNFTGIQYRHEPSGFLVTGAIDDVWQNARGELHIVDYKATAKDRDPDLEGPWQQGYKRQMEVYQWLFRQSGFTVSDVGYFVYVNGRRDREAFDAKLEFRVHLIPYTGKIDWIEPTLLDIKKAVAGSLPASAQNCEYCAYRKSAAEAAAGTAPTKKNEKPPTENKATLF